MYDAIVIGARCAGSPTAMLLAQKGYSVLLVDKATFPSDTFSTAFMRPEAIDRMFAWGLHDQLVAAGTPEYQSGHASLNGFRVPTPYPEPNYPMAPRRTVLDTILVDAARGAGATVREGFAVRAILRDRNGTVTGIRGAAKGEEPVEETASIVVGADGSNSYVARTVKAETYNVRPGTTAGGYSYFSGFEADGSELFLTDAGGAFVFPTNDGLTCLGVEGRIGEWDEVKADMQGWFDRRFCEIGAAVADQYRAAKRAERFWKLSGRDSFFRVPHGPGWALVGDAGYLKDPVLGSGIDDAFRDAELVAEAIDAGLSGREPMETALARYQQTRDEAAKDLYDLTCDVAEFTGITPELTMRLAAGVAQPAPA